MVIPDAVRAEAEAAVGAAAAAAAAAAAVEELALVAPSARDRAMGALPVAATTISATAHVMQPRSKMSKRL